VGQLGFYDLDGRLKALSAKGDPLEALGRVRFELSSWVESVQRCANELRDRRGE
jgi:hypothetical protein